MEGQKEKKGGKKEIIPVFTGGKKKSAKSSPFISIEKEKDGNAFPGKGKGIERKRSAFPSKKKKKEIKKLIIVIYFHAKQKNISVSGKKSRRERKEI